MTALLLTCLHHQVHYQPSISPYVLTNLPPELMWSTLPDLYDSDHFPITLKFGNIPNQNTDFIPKWRLSKANWEQYSHLVDSKIDTVDLSENIDKVVDKFVQTIVEAAEITIGKTSANHKQ